MTLPVVHAEIIGRSPAVLRSFYADLFGWGFDTSANVADSVSDEGEYGFVDPGRTPDGAGIPAGIGGGADRAPHTVFYVGVPDVEAALAQAEKLGGTHVLGPDRAPGRDLAVAQFRDPEGNLIGLAGPA
jgi:predicted enzyme related to lactoylglutathione lyase